MTRETAEQLIMEHLQAIDEIRKEYAPDDGYLNLFIDGGHLSAANRYYAHREEQVIHCCVFPDGEFYSFADGKEAGDAED